MLGELCDTKCRHLGGHGGWDDYGCRKYNSSSDYTTCLCDHLTHFGVLLVCTVLPFPGNQSLASEAAHLKVLVRVVAVAAAVVMAKWFYRVESGLTQV